MRCDVCMSAPGVCFKGFRSGLRLCVQKAASTREACITITMAASVAATLPSTNRAKVRKRERRLFTLMKCQPWSGMRYHVNLFANHLPRVSCRPWWPWSQFTVYPFFKIVFYRFTWKGVQIGHYFAHREHSERKTVNFKHENHVYFCFRQLLFSTLQFHRTVCLYSPFCRKPKILSFFPNNLMIPV